MENIKCHYCSTDPGTKGKGNVWKGFLDGEMRIYVCFDCAQLHYETKQQTDFKNLYTEFPVMVVKQNP